MRSTVSFPYATKAFLEAGVQIYEGFFILSLVLFTVFEEKKKSRKNSKSQCGLIYFGKDEELMRLRFREYQNYHQQKEISKRKGKKGGRGVRGKHFKLTVSIRNLKQNC